MDLKNSELKKNQRMLQVSWKKRKKNIYIHIYVLGEFKSRFPTLSLLSFFLSLKPLEGWSGA